MTVSLGESLHVRPATPVDLATIQGLLAEADLPLEDVAAHLHNTLVGEVGMQIVAAAGVEADTSVGLLRSVVVRSGHRGSGHGEAIVRATLGRAASQGVQELYLLTTTASMFFQRLGFGVISRDDAPEAIRITREFTTLCPESAVLMHRSA